MKSVKKIILVVLVTAIVGVVAFFSLSQKTDNNNDSDVTEPQSVSSQESSTPKTAVRSQKQESEPSVVEEPKAPPIKMKKTTLSLGVGETYTLQTTSNAVRWESTDNNILSVDSAGKLKANNTGKAVIKAADKDNNTAECTVTVKEAPDWVSFKNTELTLGVGESYKLPAVLPEGTASSVRKFDSSDEEIVKMMKTDWEGQFKAVKTGTAYVHVKLYNGQEAYCTVTVKAAPTKVTISKPTLTLGTGESYELTAELPKDSAASDIKYTSSNNKVAKITVNDGKINISAEGTGTANITVKTYNGKQSVCKVTVKNAPDYIFFEDNEIKLKVGQKSKLACKLSEGSAAMDISYRCSNDYVLKMTKSNGEAEFEAKAAGEAWITAETYNGLQAYCYILVEEKEKNTSGQASGNNAPQNTSEINNGVPTGGHVTAKDGTPWSDTSGRTLVYTTADSIRMTNNVAVLYSGEKYNIDADSRPDKELKYASGNQAVAKVDMFGTITAVGAGTTDVYITTPEGISDFLEVIVLKSEGSAVYPDVDATNKILDSASLSPVMTGHDEVDEMVGNLISEATDDSMSVSEKVKACYDYLIKNCTYDYSGYKAITADNYLSDEDEEIVEFAYSLLKDHVGTCENFSSAFTIIMRRLGFNANNAYGNVAMLSGGFDGHYWTDVEIGGKHYIFDPDVELSAYDGNEIKYMYYGMNPSPNYNVYRYLYLTKVHGFARG